MTITIQSEGRRHYIINAPYAMKDQLRSAGCKWDPERRAWWTGKRDVAEQLAAEAPAEGSNPIGSERPSDHLTADSEIAGKATYKGKEYLLVWSGETRRGPAAKLAFADGSKVFWAALGEVKITKVYQAREYRGRREPGMTFGRLQRLREEYAEAKRTGVDLSYRAYKEAIEAAEDQDYFDEARRLEDMGYGAWKAEQSAQGGES